MGGGGVWQKDSSSSTGTRRGVHLLPLSVTKQYGVSQSALIKNSTTEELKTQQMTLKHN